MELDSRPVANCKVVSEGLRDEGSQDCITSGVVPSQIHRVSKPDHDLKANNTDDCDEKANREHEQYPELLPLIQLHRPQLRQRQAQCDDVQKDVEECRCPALGVDVVAATRVLFAPPKPS